MTVSKLAIPCLLFLAPFSLSKAEEDGKWSTFTGTSGVSIQAEVVSLANDVVTLRAVDSAGNVNVHEIPLSRLSAQSRILALKLAALTRSDNLEKKSENSPLSALQKNLNTAAGLNLFDGNGFSDDGPDEVFQRLGLQVQQNDNHIALNSRFGDNLEIFGLVAKEVEVHGRSGLETNRISFLFSNMQTAERGLNRSDIRDESDAIIEILTQLLGAPETFRYFSPANTEVRFWKAELVGFLLNTSRKDYTFLDILNIGADGKVNYLPGNALPEQIPMTGGGPNSVDVLIHTEIHRQGNMNCYPTAATTILNHAGIPSNAQMLGKASSTSDGGTFDAGLTMGLQTILDEIEERKSEEPFRLDGRSLVTSKGGLSFDDIKERIDEGCPLFISIHAFGAVTEYMASYQYFRTLEDPDKELERELRRNRNKISLESGHAGVILGYNEELEDVFYADPLRKPGWIEYEVLADHLQGMYALIEIE